MRVLVAGVVVGQYHEATALGGHPAHDRSLACVPLAGGPKHRDELTASGCRERRQIVEHGCKSRGRVREVDDHPKRLTGIDALHSAGHTTEIAQPLEDRFVVEGEGLAQGNDGQSVVSVKTTRHANGKRRGPAADGDLHRQAVGPLPHSRRPHVGRRIRAVGDEPGTRFASHLLEQR